jgi:hypothetical protein
MPTTQSLINYALLLLYVVPWWRDVSWIGVRSTLERKVGCSRVFSISHSIYISPPLRYWTVSLSSSFWNFSFRFCYLSLSCCCCLPRTFPFFPCPSPPFPLPLHTASIFSQLSTEVSCFLWTLLLLLFSPSPGVVALTWGCGWAQQWWQYLLLAGLDVEANYLAVLAYQYTSLSSAMLLDCISIPCVMVLGHFLLQVKTPTHTQREREREREIGR